MKHLLAAFSTLAILLGFSQLGYGHCEIPCGIYGDQARLDAIAEDITTVEKSMKQITELGAAGDKNYNQIVRWVTNKEEHANKIQHVVTQYFMTQRLKPVEDTNSDAYKKYVKELTLLHNLMVHAMKAKQTTDLTFIEAMRADLAAFSASYMAKK